jgi:hypothetical protein
MIRNLAITAQFRESKTIVKAQESLCLHLQPNKYHEDHRISEACFRGYHWSRSEGLLALLLKRVSKEENIQGVCNFRPMCLKRTKFHDNKFLSVAYAVAPRYSFVRPLWQGMYFGAGSLRAFSNRKERDLDGKDGQNRPC